MLPGPFEMPPLPSLPFYVHPVILWAIILLAAVALAITFFRFIFAAKGERTTNFLSFFAVVLLIGTAYMVAMNWPEVQALFRNTF